MVNPKIMRTFAPLLSKASQTDDSLAQLVEHNTFNVGVMGSSPMRVTERVEKDLKMGL